MIDDQVAQLRREYEALGLNEKDMADDPITQFRTWFDGILESGLQEPNAFILATADAKGVPSARAVPKAASAARPIAFFQPAASSARLVPIWSTWSTVLRRKTAPLAGP